MTIVELNFEGLGYREIKIVTELLQKYNESNNQDLPYPFKIGYNLDSDNAFIFDEDYNTFMLNNEDQLEQFYNCGNCGKEGFKVDFEGRAAETNCKECLDQFVGSE